MQDRDSPAVKKGEETFGDFKKNLTFASCFSQNWI